jgi:predicted phage tail protein
MIRDVYLYGAAGREFGRHFSIDINTPQEAIRAISALRPGVRKHLRVGNWRVIVGKPHIRNSISADQIWMNAGSQPIHIVPSTGAAGDGGVGKVVTGVVLIGASLITAGLAAPAGMAFFGVGGALAAEVSVAGLGLGFSYGSVALLGASMFLGGVASMLTSPPSMGPTDVPTAQAPAGDQPSFLFNGAVNNSQQGSPIPLLFGTHLIGSIVASTGLNAEDIG